MEGRNFLAVGCGNYFIEEFSLDKIDDIIRAISEDKLFAVHNSCSGRYPTLPHINKWVNNSAFDPADILRN